MCFYSLTRMCGYSLFAHSGVSMLPENADLAAAALSELPPPSTSAADPFAPSSDGTVPALHFICSLWSYLHQQLQLLAAKHNAESEAKAAEAPEADQPLTEDLTLDQRVADPFAAVAASRVNASDAPVVAGNEVEAQLAAKIDEANEAEEEMVCQRDNEPRHHSHSRAM